MTFQWHKWGPDGRALHWWGRYLALNVHVTSDCEVWEWRLKRYRTTNPRPPVGINWRMGPIHLVLLWTGHL